MNRRKVPIRQVRVNPKAGLKFTTLDSKEKGSKPDRAAKQATGEATQGVLPPARPSGGLRPQLETGYRTLKPLQRLKGCGLRDAAFQAPTAGRLPCGHRPASAGTSVPGSTLPPAVSRPGHRIFTHHTGTSSCCWSPGAPAQTSASTTSRTGWWEGWMKGGSGQARR